jgi:hypothetical protein|tara:strand:+ start:57 stop:449 length:393 start_codon:yes stop_codon:yes gene_type:complete
MSEKDKWYKGSISFNDFYAEEIDGEVVYKVVANNKIFSANELFDLETMLNSVGWDVTDICHDYDISPNDADILHDGKMIKGYEANKICREQYKNETEISSAITYAERKRLEPEMDMIVQKRENNTNKKLN